VPARGRAQPGASRLVKPLTRRRHAGCFMFPPDLVQSQQPARRVARAARRPRAAHWKDVRPIGEALRAVVAVNITARNDPSTAWFGSAVISVLLLIFGILGLITAPQETLSVWTKLSRGLILWASEQTYRTLLITGIMLTLTRAVWAFGPASIHEAIVRCEQDTRIRYYVWDGSEQISECKQAVALSLWRPFTRGNSINRLISCHASSGWVAATTLPKTNEVSCPPAAAP